MKSKSCDICQRTPTTKCACGMRLCVDHESELKHDCAHAKKLDAIASDPKAKREWLRAHEGEESLTSDVVEALNKLPEIEEAWQAKKRGGVRAGQVALRVPDVLAYAKDGAILIGVELKRQHKDDCPCESCVGQKDWGARLRARGGVFVENARTVAQAVDGVKLGLAMARGRERKAG